MSIRSRADALDVVVAVLLVLLMVVTCTNKHAIDRLEHQVEAQR